MADNSPADNLFFFSADDRQIDPSDPVLKSVPPVGVVQQPKSHPLPESHPTDLSVLSALRAGPNRVGGGFPVSMNNEGGLLYSFTLPSTKPHPTKPPSVTESFGILSTQVRIIMCVCVLCVLCVLVSYLQGHVLHVHVCVPIAGLLSGGLLPFPPRGW